MHKEGPNGYAEARAAVAISDTVDGNYKPLSSFRPLGSMSRDDYLFKDDDDVAYFISAANNNADLKIYRLTSDYLGVDREVVTLYFGQFRETPVLSERVPFTTSVLPSLPARDPTRSTIASPNLSPGRGRSCVRLPRAAHGTPTTHGGAFGENTGSTVIFNLDRWVKPMRHVWLPLEFNGDGPIKALEWYDHWTIDAKTGLAKTAPVPTPDPKNLAQGKQVTATYDKPGQCWTTVIIGYDDMGDVRDQNMRPWPDVSEFQVFKWLNFLRVL